MSMIAVWRPWSFRRSACWHFGVLMPHASVVQYIKSQGGGKSVLAHTSYLDFKKGDTYPVWLVPIPNLSLASVVVHRAVLELKKQTNYTCSTATAKHLLVTAGQELKKHSKFLTCTKLLP